MVDYNLALCNQRRPWSNKWAKLHPSTQSRTPLQAMGFAPVDGKNGKWSKTYSESKYCISVALGKRAADCRIDYGSAIKSNAGRTTTQNRSQPESLVVLECVDRFLPLGYPSDSLILEKQ